MIVRSVVAAIGAALLSACATVDGYSSASMPVVDQPPSSDASYFSPSLLEPSITCNYSGTPKKVAAIDDFDNRSYSLLFGLAKEPSLYMISRQPRPAESSTLRFTWRRSFDPVILIRVDFAGSAAPRLIAKQIADDSGRIDRRMTKNLSADEARQLQLLAYQGKIFNFPKSEECVLQMDGSTWAFESADSSGYHFIERLSPRSGPVRDVGEYLLTLTGWNVGEIY